MNNKKTISELINEYNKKIESDNQKLRNKAKEALSYNFRPLIFEDCENLLRFRIKDTDLYLKLSETSKTGAHTMFFNVELWVPTYSRNICSYHIFNLEQLIKALAEARFEFESESIIAEKSYSKII